jgi:hypothetical protein
MVLGEPSGWRETPWCALEGRPAPQRTRLLGKQEQHCFCWRALGEGEGEWTPGRIWGGAPHGLHAHPQPAGPAGPRVPARASQGWDTPVARQGVGLLGGVACAAPAARLMTMMAAAALPPRRLEAVARPARPRRRWLADFLAFSAAGALDPGTGPENGVDVLVHPGRLCGGSAAGCRAALGGTAACRAAGGRRGRGRGEDGEDREGLLGERRWCAAHSQRTRVS